MSEGPLYNVLLGLLWDLRLSVGFGVLDLCERRNEKAAIELVNVTPMEVSSASNQSTIFELVKNSRTSQKFPDSSSSPGRRTSPVSVGHSDFVPPDFCM